MVKWSFCLCILYYFSGLYLAWVLLLSAVAILLTVGIMILAKREGYLKSRSFWHVITRIAAKVTCHPLPVAGKSRHTSTVSPKLEDVSDDESDESEKVMPRIELEWTEVSLILDKFCFIIFSIMSIVMNFSFVIALTVGGEVNEADWFTRWGRSVVYDLVEIYTTVISLHCWLCYFSMPW